MKKENGRPLWHDLLLVALIAIGIVAGLVFLMPAR